MDRVFRYRVPGFLVFVYAVHVVLFAVFVIAWAWALTSEAMSGDLMAGLLTNGEPDLACCVINICLWLGALWSAAFASITCCAFWTLAYRSLRHVRVPAVGHGKSGFSRVVCAGLAAYGATLFLLVLYRNMRLLGGFFGMAASDSLSGPLVIAIAGPFLLAMSVAAVIAAAGFGLFLPFSGFCMARMVRYMAGHAGSIENNGGLEGNLLDDTGKGDCENGQ